jgi:AcrR family transcriptional regulator
MMYGVPPRATSMSPDDRRKAIVTALVPLIVERGGEVSTREIAQAAGIAEGTIFRVFPDKKSLLMAAAEEAINPADGQREFDEAMVGLTELWEKVVVAATRMQQRMNMTMAVMMAVRRHLMSEHEHQHPPDKPGPPEFVVRAQAELNARLTSMFEPHRDELAVTPEIATTALRSLVFGSGRFELGLGPSLGPEDIAALLLHGILRKES